MSNVDDATKAATESIRRRIGLSQMREIVGEHVTLNRSNRGPCPFHGGTDANLSIFHKGGAAGYHCFVCGASGDVFRFVMDVTGDTFMAVRKALAERVGVILPAPRARRPVVEGAVATGLGPAVQTLTDAYCRAALPADAPAWAVRGAAARLVGFAGSADALADALLVAGAPASVMADSGLCTVAGADPRAGQFVVILRDREGTPVGCVGVTADGAACPGTVVQVWPDTTMAGWASARSEAARLGWVVLAPDLVQYVLLATQAPALRVPVVASLQALSSPGAAWAVGSEQALLRENGVTDVLVMAEGLDSDTRRWAYGTAETILTGGLRVRFAGPLPDVPVAESGVLVRTVLEAWGQQAADAYAARVALIPQAAGYATRGWAFAFEKIAPTLHAAMAGPDPVLAEAYLCWTTRAFSVGDARLRAALAAGAPG